MPDYVARIAKLNQLRKKTQKAAKGKIKKKVKNISSQSISEITGAEWIMIGIIAVVNDACDYFGIDLLLFRLLDMSTAVILGSWCFLRLHRFPSARFGTTFLMEMIPGLGEISPTWTIFLVSIYIEHNKIKK